MRSKTPGKSKEEASAQVQIPLSPESIGHLRTKKRTKVYMVIPLTRTYMEVLEQLQSSFPVSESELSQSSSFIPFLVTCAAALECLLNDSLIMHSYYIFGPTKYWAIQRQGHCRPLCSGATGITGIVL